MNNTKSKVKKKEKVTPEETTKEDVTEIKTADKKPKGTSKSIPIERLVPFPNHPYKVTDDEAMDDLIESIKTYGVLEPISVRPLEDSADEYEIISGHRRCHAALRAGLKRMPALVYDVDRDDATIMLVDSNCHREVILPSEKAFSYRMKAEALSHQGKSLTSGQIVPKSDDNRTTASIGEPNGESYKTVQRYIRLTYLIPELLMMMDEGKIALSVGVELSYLTENQQREVLENCELNDCTPSYSQANRMHRIANEGELDARVISQIMNEEKANQKTKLSFKLDEIGKFFPKNTTPAVMYEKILKLLEGEYQRQQKNKSQDAR